MGDFERPRVCSDQGKFGGGSDISLSGAKEVSYQLDPGPSYSRTRETPRISLSISSLAKTKTPVISPVASGASISHVSPLCATAGEIQSE